MVCKLQAHQCPLWLIQAALLLCSEVPLLQCSCPPAHCHFAGPSAADARAPADQLLPSAGRPGAVAGQPVREQQTSADVAAEQASCCKGVRW